MYDFWYTLGVSIVDPGLMKAVRKAKPDFLFVDTVKGKVGRTIADVVAGHKSHVRAGSYSGQLIQAPTERVRDAIGAYLLRRWPGAPPVGIYCAGRMNQWELISAFGASPSMTFDQILQHARKGYKRARKAFPHTDLVTIPAIIGVSLMDQFLRAAIVGKDKTLTPKLKEFGIRVSNDDPNWLFISTLIADHDFTKIAAFKFMQNGSDPWDADIAAEQLYFWPGKSEHAVF